MATKAAAKPRARGGLSALELCAAAARINQLCRRGLGQFECALRDSGGGGGSVALARDLHGRKGKFDAALVEHPLDHCIGLSPDDELLSRQGHHLRPELDREIAEFHIGDEHAEHAYLEHRPRAQAWPPTTLGLLRFAEAPLLPRHNQ
jgi:hypothetical protein